MTSTNFSELVGGARKRAHTTLVAVDGEHLTAGERHSVVDVPRVEGLIRELLEALGEDAEREGLRDTPRRVAAWWSEFLDHDPGRMDTSFGYASSGEGYILVRDIEAWSLCEHHLLPFSLMVHVAYVPSGRVLGLSKLVRTVADHAHNLQLQERITNDVAEAVAKTAGTQDVAVFADGEHLCMSMRGVRARSARTSTVCLLGRFRDDTDLVSLVAGALRGNRS